MRTEDYSFDIDDTATLIVSGVKIHGHLIADGYSVIEWIVVPGGMPGKPKIKKPNGERLTRLNGVFKAEATEIKKALSLSWEEDCLIESQYEGDKLSDCVSIGKTDIDTELSVCLKH